MSGSLAQVKLKDESLSRSHEFNVGPGDGVYFPSTSPHMTRSTPEWVRAGDGVSISIGVVFYTDVTKRHANVHAWNRLLRRAGVAPRPPGESPLIDSVKYPLGRALMTAGRLRGFQPRAGF